MRDHGGNLDGAIKAFGGDRADWIDLSTGINTVPYPVGPISPEAWLGYVLGRLAPGPVRWCMQKGLERSYPCLSTTAPGAP